MAELDEHGREDFAAQARIEAEAQALAFSAEVAPLPGAAGDLLRAIATARTSAEHTATCNGLGEREAFRWSPVVAAAEALANELRAQS